MKNLLQAIMSGALKALIREIQGELVKEELLIFLSRILILVGGALSNERG
jgi:hypothetical protein